MNIRDQGVINRGEPGTGRAISTFPALIALADGSLLATYRVGSGKDSADGTLELRRSQDGGRSWSAPETPFRHQPERDEGIAQNGIRHRPGRRASAARRPVGRPPDLSGHAPVQTKKRRDACPWRW